MNCTGFVLVGLALAATAIAQDLPDGRGRDTVLRACGQCQGADVFASDRHSRDYWDNIITQMADRGMDLRSEDYEVVITYLTTSLGPTPKAATVHVNKASAKECRGDRGRGSFSEWRELTKIKGVDPQKIEAKKEAITF